MHRLVDQNGPGKDTLATEKNRAIQLILSTSDAGVDIFNFALFPEGEAMRTYNRTSADACFTHFTSAEVWATGSAEAFLTDMVSQVHPDDQAEMVSYIQAHYQSCYQGIDPGAVPSFSSQRFRARKQQGDWGWHEVRSRIYGHENGLLITEGVMTELTEVMQLLLEDKLTTLPNRLASEQWLQGVLDHEPDPDLAVINLDLDRFQSINDSFGQASGDVVIQQAAAMLRQQLPAGAWLARLEADEFLVILHPNRQGSDHPSAPASSDLATEAEAAVRLFQETIQRGFAERLELPLRLTLSGGASLNPSGVTCARTLLQQANTALMEAKQRGQAGYCIYSEAFSQAIEWRLHLERDLDLAIERGGFQLVYQPQVDRHGDWIGAEVLLRWPQPDGSSIGPDVFIPIAEQTGQIRGLSQWVLDTACSQLDRWRQEGLQPPRLAINLSSVQLEPSAEEPSVGELLLATCRRHGITPDQIELEITETAVLRNRALALQQLEEVVAGGFRLGIDDFGTGYSSLQLLQTFPVQVVKVDKSFVQRLPESTTDLQLVQGVLLIARQLGLQTVAEGVENEAQWQLLQTLGCDTYQGYFFDKPLTAQQMGDRMRATLDRRGP
ncbi:putative bifunctional diguanylate cyclase/phosphodiesterase [Vulcanococcus limneticus]|uniref:putative bifunctional diguanylate cyclase/phosphodiesterase n=1 Tax=Vulcanococcus limneticus TaxID=2170428 RepID=UPI00398C1D00